MKKIIFLIIILCSFSQSGYSQQGKQKMMLLKASYITDAINLTPSEAEKFWPVYNLYTDKIHDLRLTLENGLMKNLLKNGNIDAISDAEAEQFLKSFSKVEFEILKQKEKLNLELSKIISAKKIIKLQKAERDFNKRLLQEYGKRKGMQKY